MARIPSDDEQIASIRVHVARSGGTRRPCLRLPDDEDLDSALESGTCETIGIDEGDLVRLVVDRSEYHARIAADSRGRIVRGAYANRRLARESGGEGENELVAWLRECDREPGDPVLLDVVVPGEVYGLRLPGERVVYDADPGPRSSLSEIAERLDG